MSSLERIPREVLDAMRDAADASVRSNEALERMVLGPTELDSLRAFKAKAIELYPSLAEDWKRIERSSLEHAQKFEDTKEDGA